MGKSLGIFDSGLGGLTVLREVVKANRYDRIVYFGDTGRVPYGTRSRETIEKYAMQDVRFLLSRNIDEIIIACGTVSANALDALRHTFSQPIIGVIDVSAAAAVRATKNGRIGVIGTKATVGSQVYPQKIRALAPSTETFCVPCPLLVSLVEYGFAREPNEIAEKACAFYLKELKEKGIDTLILGCTHFPLLKEPIAHYLGTDVTLIDSGEELARELREDTPTKTAPNISFYVSDDAASFAENAAVFLGDSLKPTAEYVDIQKF